MVGAGKIQNGVADDYGCVFQVLHKVSGQRVIVELNDHALADPFPELVLRSPELLAVDAKDARSPFVFSGLGNQHVSASIFG